MLLSMPSNYGYRLVLPMYLFMVIFAGALIAKPSHDGSIEGPRGSGARMIIAALPAYNEAEALPRLLQRMREAQRDLPESLRVVVVDDGSKDETAAVAERCDSADMRVEVVRHDRNRGLHGALDTGFRAALERAQPGDWILTMDADERIRQT